MIYQGDALTVLKTFDADSIDCCITSPPYWGLRDYGVEGQLGLEKTPEEYVAKMVEVFREVRRVLKLQGTLWLNLGDSYWGGKGQSGQQSAEYQEKRKDVSLNKPYHQIAGHGKTRPSDSRHELIKPKDLVGIPWRVAFALQADGWYLRQDIIWHKPNPMPESVTDRCTKAHEYIFLLAKSPRYYYDAESIKERAVWDVDGNGTIARVERQKDDAKSSPTKMKNGIRRVYPNGKHKDDQQSPKTINGWRNKRSVWTVTTHGFPEAHFATFPEALVEPMIKAGCTEGGVILDPFNGAGTTGAVATRLGRKYIGIELNPDYIKMSERRIEKAQKEFDYKTSQGNLLETLKK